MLGLIKHRQKHPYSLINGSMHHHSSAQLTTVTEHEQLVDRMTIKGKLPCMFFDAFDKYIHFQNITKVNILSNNLNKCQVS